MKFLYLDYLMFYWHVDVVEYDELSISYGLALHVMQ